MRRALASSTFAIAMALALPASADKAEELFKEGVALRESNVEQACQKFEESLGFNPAAIGTLLSVAICDEDRGRIASAVGKFRDVADRAREQNYGEYLRAAEAHLAALLPELSHLTITFAELAPETKVLLDDRVVAVEQMGKLAVDPGDRVIVVTAPGRVAYRTTVRIEKRETKTLEIPRLANSVVKSSRRTIGKITVAAGGAAIGTGIVLGLVARSRYNSAAEDCNKNGAGERVCSGDGASRIESARTLGNVGTVVTLVGIGTAVVGGALWWRSSTAERTGGVSYLGPQVGPDGAGVVAIGRF